MNLIQKQLIKDYKKVIKYFNDKVTLYIYQVYLMILIAIVSSILITFIKVHPVKYYVITEDDKRVEAYNCYQTSDELRCLIDTKVKQYGRVK